MEETGLIAYSATLNQVCVPYSTSYAVFNNFPTVDEYTSDMCSGTFTARPEIVTQCDATAFDPTDVGSTNYPAEPYVKTDLIAGTLILVTDPTTTTTVARRANALRGSK